MRLFNFFQYVFLLVIMSCSGGEKDINTSPTSSIRPFPNYDIPSNNEYIVVFKDSASFNIASDTFFKQGELISKYENVNGFHVQIEPSRLSELIKNTNVKYIESNQIFHINTQQAGATWGIDRIDAKKGLDSTYNYSNSGQGVTVYVVDTGVDTAHTELSGRVKPGYSAVSGGYEDCNGHGTHVSGTIAGKTYGVAKSATIVPVRVLDCQGSGSLSGILDGLNWLISNAKKPAVANMSLGGSKSQALDDGVKKAIASGIPFAVAGGNDTKDACNYSPANLPEAITVAAMDRNDARASFSNFGSCIDLFAPGKDITSAKMGGGTTPMSGTSMASPHVAGVVALFLERKPNASPSEVWSYMKGLATSGVVSDVSGSPNLLVYTDPNGGGNPQPTPDPTPNPTPSPTPIPNPTPSPTPVPTPIPNPTPSPTPPSPEPGKPSFCETNRCLHYKGILNLFELATLPPERPFFANGKTIEGKLVAPQGFQLILWRTTDPYYRNWEIVADSTSAIKYTAIPGFYAWVIVANDTNGKYEFWFTIK